MDIMIAEGKTDIPQWMRTTLIDDDDTIYLPAGIFDHEMRALMAAIFDCVGFVKHEGHAYLPSAWLRKEYPRGRELIDVMVKRTEKEMAKQNL